MLLTEKEIPLIEEYFRIARDGPGIWREDAAERYCSIQNDLFPGVNVRRWPNDKSLRFSVRNGYPWQGEIAIAEGIVSFAHYNGEGLFAVGLTDEPNMINVAWVMSSYRFSIVDDVVDRVGNKLENVLRSVQPTSVGRCENPAIADVHRASELIDWYRSVHEAIDDFCGRKSISREVIDEVRESRTAAPHYVVREESKRVYIDWVFQIVDASTRSLPRHP